MHIDSTELNPKYWRDIQPTPPPFFERPVVVVDVETTGLDPMDNQPVQVGLARLNRDGVICGLSVTMVRVEPRTVVDPEAMAIHGITEARANAFGIAEEKLEEWLIAHAPPGEVYLAAWNPTFDIPFLKEAAYRHQPCGAYSWPYSYHVLDIWSIYRSQFPSGPKRFEAAASLVLQAAHYRQAHDAMRDAEDEALVLSSLMRRIHSSLGESL